MTKCFCVVVLSCFFALAGAGTVPAQGLVYGIGFSDYSADDGNDTVSLSVEYQGLPFLELGRLRAALTAGVEFDSEADLFAGAGVVSFYALDRGWFFEASAMPGYYDAGRDENDLGGNLQFRTLLGVGKTIGSGSSLSLAFTHKSNAGLNTRNPGLNAVHLRWHRPF